MLGTQFAFLSGTKIFVLICPHRYTPRGPRCPGQLGPHNTDINASFIRRQLAAAFCVQRPRNQAKIIKCTCLLIKMFSLSISNDVDYVHSNLIPR